MKTVFGFLFLLGSIVILAQGPVQTGAVLPTRDVTAHDLYHGYDAKDGGKPKLIVQELVWDSKGWPVAGNSASKNSATSALQ